MLKEVGTYLRYAILSFYYYKVDTADISGRYNLIIDRFQFSFVTNIRVRMVRTCNFFCSSYLFFVGQEEP